MKYRENFLYIIFFHKTILFILNEIEKINEINMKGKEKVKMENGKFMNL